MYEAWPTAVTYINLEVLCVFVASSLKTWSIIPICFIHALVQLGMKTQSPSGFLFSFEKVPLQYKDAGPWLFFKTKVPAYGLKVVYPIV